LTNRKTRDIVAIYMKGIQRVDDNTWFKSSHLWFKDDGPSKGGKTRIFNVFGSHHILIGHVKWYGPWRQYCFFPLDSTLYNKDCMRQLADFTELVTREHKDKLPKVQYMKNKLKEHRARKIERMKKKKENSLTNKEKYETMVLEVEQEVAETQTRLVEGVETDAPEL